MSIETKLEAFSSLVRAYARSREVERQVYRHGTEFEPALVERVADAHREKAMKLVYQILHKVGAVEIALIEARRTRRDLEQKRIEWEYVIDEVALHRQVGDADSSTLDGRESKARDALDALQGQMEQTSSDLEQLRRALDLWYDVGADTAITM